MTTYGLLISYEWCSGCQSCEVACKEEHGLGVGAWGIRVLDDGPWSKTGSEHMGSDFNWNHVPVPTDLCDLCADRVAAGKDPTCVHHCLAQCMEFGAVEELAQKLGNKPKQALFVPR